ncbi:MAG: adenylate/guanylate cyclase domain-containing protein [Marmoricola sp.]
MHDPGSLARRGPLGRFVAPVEDAYLDWHQRRLRPLAATLAGASAACWIFNGFVTQMLGADPALVAYTVCWGVNVPALVLGTLYLRRADAQHVVLVTTALLVLTGVGLIAVLLPTLPDIEPTVFALAATFFGLLAPLIQLPFRHTFFFGVLVVVVGVVKIQQASDGAADSDAALIVSLLLVVVTGLLIGPAVAFANERDLRARFVVEQTVDYQRTLIRRYAPGAVVSRIELGDTTVDHPQRRKVTVFFSDVVGFTTMADRVDPEALAEIVNDYLGSLADLIERHGGTLNEFAGDGVMAIFGAPEEMEPADQVRAALAAARELQASLPEWSRGWYQHGIIEDAKARVGINTGTISVGTFGSAVRATYTGIGLQTNIAARVQAQAEPGGILLSNTSWHLVKDLISCEARGEVMVKGVHFPIELYQPL